MEARRSTFEQFEGSVSYGEVDVSLKLFANTQNKAFTQKIMFFFPSICPYLSQIILEI